MYNFFFFFEILYDSQIYGQQWIFPKDLLNVLLKTLI